MNCSYCGKEIIGKPYASGRRIRWNDDGSVERQDTAFCSEVCMWRHNDVTSPIPLPLPAPEYSLN